jgi:hypothetical protein
MEGSLPCSQKPTTAPYTPLQYSPHVLATTFQAVHFLTGFLPKPHKHFFLSMRPTCPAHFILPGLIIPSSSLTQLFINCGPCCFLKALGLEITIIVRSRIAHGFVRAQAVSSAALEAELCSVCFSVPM